MQIAGAVLAAVLVTAGYYLAMSLMNQKAGLELRQEGWHFFSVPVQTVGGITFLATGMIAYIRLPAFSLPAYVLTLLLIWAMSVLAVTDYRRQIIPNRFLLLLLLLWGAVSGVYVILDTGNGIGLFFQALAGAGVGGLTFLLCYLLSGKQVGAGDVKLAFVMGLYLTGQRIIGAIFYGAVLCCAYSLIQVWRKKLGMKDGVPIVPFLYLGVLITLLII